MTVMKFQIRNKTDQDIDLQQVEESLEPLLCMLENLEVCETCRINENFSSMLVINDEVKHSLSVNLSQRTIDIDA
ncbi:MAG: hypothetical protein ACTSRU_09975 [Candidatus Hodarchaeales archaeon]